MKTILVSAVLSVVLASSALAATPINLVTNGDFSATTLTRSQQFTTEVTGWTNAVTNGYTGYGYNFLIQNGTADSTGFYSLENNHDYIYGPSGTTRPGYADGSNYAANGFTGSSPAAAGSSAANGGNFLLMDGDVSFHGAVSQTLNNLNVGQVYNLTFDWAGAAWFTTPGVTTQRFDVTFGNSTQSTATVTDQARAFSGWQKGAMSFTATASSQTLSFLAQGTPTGLPPSLLLDNVSLTAAVPEPASWTMMIVGFGVIGGALRRSRTRQSVVFA